MRPLLTGILGLLLIGSGLGQEPTYTIQLKTPGVGDRAKVQIRDNSNLGFTIDVMGNELKNSEKKSESETYISEILAQPPGAKKPTRISRTYTQSEKTEEGKKSTAVYANKTVLIAKTKDKYTFTVDGKDLDEEDAKDLEEEFNKKEEFPLENPDLMPDKPVKINETWTVDSRKVAKAFEEEGPLTLDQDQTVVKGQLKKVYTKNGQRFGVIELTMTLAVKELKLDNETFTMKPGSRVLAQVTLEGCIDGQSQTLTEKAKMTFDLTGDIPNGKMTFSGDALFEQTTEELGKK